MTAAEYRMYRNYLIRRDDEPTMGYLVYKSVWNPQSAQPETYTMGRYFSWETALRAIDAMEGD